MPAPAQPKWMTWTGWVLTVLVVAMMVMSGSMKFSNHPELLKSLEKFQMAHETMKKIGVVELACALLFLIPQTAVLGAILLVGYLGGAVFVHVQGGDPVKDVLTPVMVGVVAWLAVFLREPRLRALVPWRTSDASPTVSQ